LQVSPLNISRAVVDKDGRPLQVLQQFSESVAILPVLLGTGTPEGVIEAQQGRLYLDTTGAANARLYIKNANDIAGNRKNGWVTNL
jgi:hypothetical protein